MKPTYDALVQLLKDAPARQAIGDSRYWTWHGRVEAVLQQVQEAGG